MCKKIKKKKFKLITYDYYGNELQSFDFYTHKQAIWFINHSIEITEYFRYIIFKMNN